MITGKLNLLNLYCVKRFEKSASGLIECLIIPIEQNKLFVGEKGVYLDFIGFEIREPKEGSKDTHIVKQSLSKEERESMTDEELKAMPILGNLSVWSGGNEKAPISSTETLNENSDLPF
jgi:hypothetical protein